MFYLFHVTVTNARSKVSGLSTKASYPFYGLASHYLALRSMERVFEHYSSVDLAAQKTSRPA